MSVDEKSGYYDVGGIETLSIIRAKTGATGYLHYCQGNALKYLCRCFHKGTLIRDLEKAKIYIEQMLSELSD